MQKLSDKVKRDFKKVLNISEFEIETDTGWADISCIGKTEKYEIWELSTLGGASLSCADTHIVFTEQFEQIYVKDLKIGSKIITKNGIDIVSNITQTGKFEHMFDVQVSDAQHRYWSNDILSHNSSIKSAIVYAVYNKSIDNVSLPRLINSTNAAKNTLMEVILDFNKGTDNYVIHRKRGEAHGVTLLKNGQDITPDSINETDALIELIVGFSYEMFTRTIVFSGTTVPFLDLPISLQRNYIEELFNISLLSEKAVKLKKQIQNTEADIRVEEAVLKEKETAAKLQAKRLTDIEQKVIAWEDSTQRGIAEYQAQLKSIEGIDFEVEEQLLAELNSTKQQLTQLQNKIASEQRALSRAATELAKLQKEHEHLVVNNCPYCLQLMPNAAEKIVELDSVLRTTTEIVADYKLSLGELLIQEEALAVRKTELTEKIKYPNLSALLEIKSNAAIIQAKLEQLQAAENPHFETFEQFEAEVKIAVDYTSLDTLKSKLEHQHFLLKLLTDKNSFIRKRIISKTVPFLNLQLNTYATKLGLPHTVTFMDDMGCEVAEYGRVLDFGNLSSGEKKRVNLAMSLAFRDVLHHLHAKVNLLFVDEIDASLDHVGVEQVIHLLKEKTKQEQLASFVIMHREGIEGKFDRELVIHKKNGFSEMELRYAEVYE